MKFDNDIWEDGPTDEVLADPSLISIRGQPLLLGVQRLRFQLQLCYDIRSLLSIWDGDSLSAWQEVADYAGGIIQRSLIKDLAMTTWHLIDSRKDASSIVNVHQECLGKNLVTGPFKSFYLPLYRIIIEKGKNLKELRDTLLAHTNKEQLEGSIWQNSSQRLNSNFNMSDLYGMLDLLTWYVTLLHRVLGIGIGNLERPVKGSAELKAAIMAAAVRD